MKSLIAIVGIILFAIVLILIGPLLTIWAFNTLFPALAIPYTLSNWAAVIILGAFFRANVSIKKKD